VRSAIVNRTELVRRIQTGKTAVLAQREAFIGGFGRVTSYWKADGTRVTDADLAISAAIHAALTAEFPDDQFFSEELSHGAAAVARAAEWSWMLDPIDGTNNYALGVPLTAISLALLHNGVPAYGFVYDFGRRALLHGGSGFGVHEDDAPLANGFGRSGADKIVAVHTPLDPKHIPALLAIVGRYKLRAFGSGALHLTYASLGMVDACLDFTVRVWDIAAAAAFCTETGAEVHYFNGSPFPLQEFNLKMTPMRYLAGSPEACKEILEAFEAAGWKP
jgi:myo-inositol-1(or 4)-monophosphatase